MPSKGYKYYVGKKYDGMMGRCYRKTDVSYKNYGGRGIRVCSEWIKNITSFRDWFESQISDMGYTQSDIENNPKLVSVDRIDVNGHYTPENCRLTSMQNQIRNRRISDRRTVISAEGEKITI